MPLPLRVIGIGGSLADESASLAALRLALDAAADAGAAVELFDVRALGLPMYLPDDEAVPRTARALADAAHGAHGLIWSSPLYHGTVSGAFKNALDWLQLLANREPPFLTDKVIGLISTAGGQQGLQAVNTMEFAVRALRGWAVPLVMPIARAWEVFDAQGRSRDERVTRDLRTLGTEVVRAARQFADEGVCDYSTDPRTAVRYARIPE